MDDILFSWLHISDLHFGHPNNKYWDQQKVLQELINDVKKAPLRNEPFPEALFITGDIGYSGAEQDENEYTVMAKGFLKNITDNLSINNNQIIMIPGNHDVDQKAFEGQGNTSLLEKLREGGKFDLKDNIGNDSWALFNNRFKEYLVFSKGYGPDNVQGRLFWQHQYEARSGFKLKIVGLNTALLALDHEDYQKLQVGSTQMKLIPSAEENDMPIIVLSHHPLDWLEKSDMDNIKGWVESKANIHLYGHVHDANSYEINYGDGRNLKNIIAGAGYCDSDEQKKYKCEHRYNIAAIIANRQGQLKIKMWPRTWTTRTKRYNPDQILLPDRKFYVEFNLQKDQTKKINDEYADIRVLIKTNPSNFHEKNAITVIEKLSKKTRLDFKQVRYNLLRHKSNNEIVILCQTPIHDAEILMSILPNNDILNQFLMDLKIKSISIGEQTVDLMENSHVLPLSQKNDKWEVVKEESVDSYCDRIDKLTLLKKEKIERFLKFTAQRFKNLYQLDINGLDIHPLFQSLRYWLNFLTSGIILDEEEGNLKRMNVRHVIMRAETVTTILNALNKDTLNTLGQNVGKTAAEDLVENLLQKERLIPASDVVFVKLWNFLDRTGGWGQIELVPSPKENEWRIKIKNSFLRTAEDNKNLNKLNYFWCGYIDGFIATSLPNLEKLMLEMDEGIQKEIALPKYHEVINVKCVDTDTGNDIFIVSFNKHQFYEPLIYIERSKKEFNKREWGNCILNAKEALVHVLRMDIADTSLIEEINGKLESFVDNINSTQDDAINCFDLANSYISKLIITLKDNMCASLNN